MGESGYRNSMVGTYGDVVLAEAVVKGVLTGADAEKAWNALRRDAREEAPPGGAVGQSRPYESTSSTATSPTIAGSVTAFPGLRARGLVLTSVDDWSLTPTGRRAQPRRPASTESSRGRREADQKGPRGCPAVLRSQSGLMRPKSRTGRFSVRFDETRWGDGYTEGSPWHHSFPPFDVELLSRLHGSKEN